MNILVITNSMIFKYEHLDKTKTFENTEFINLFTGVNSVYQGKFEHEPISISLFYKIKTLYPNMNWVFTYDDDTEMEASEWVECITELMKRF
jgi:hypothetical protein